MGGCIRLVRITAAREFVLHHLAEWFSHSGPAGCSWRADGMVSARHSGSGAAKTPPAGPSTGVSGKAFPTAPWSSGFPMAIRAVDGGHSMGPMRSSLRRTELLSSRVGNVSLTTFPPVPTLNASRLALPMLAEAPVEADLDSGCYASRPGGAWFVTHSWVLLFLLKVPRSPV